MQKLKETVEKALFNKVLFLTFITQTIFLTFIIYVVLNAQFVTKFIAFLFGLITVPILVFLFIFQIWGMFSVELMSILELAGDEKNNGRKSTTEENWGIRNCY